ncbi:MAG: PAS domain S-box protein, partial [Anaerolineae bacterium]|nr:PAS domain S-box protein [Anaerolineae bacterium]
GERILGHPPEQLIGESALQFVHPQDLSAISEALNQVRQRPGVITSIEFRFQHQDGTYHWLEATSNNLLDNPVIQGIVINARDVSKRKAAEEEREKLIGELQAALDQVRTLSGLLPICSSCKKIRDDAGYWHQVEEYIRDHSEVEFTHSLCPDCARKLFPEYYDDED